jgi:16S rRNA (guanine527-N7)-methyltransferase
VIPRDFRSRLAERFELARFNASPELVDRLEVYYDLLAAWNQRINLTGMSLLELTTEALDRLLVEPVVASRHAAPGAKRIIDIGSGGGSPAIPFAVALPGAQLLMVESRARKSVFLKEALRALQMDSSDVVTSRYEDLLEGRAAQAVHDVLTIRAVRVEMEDLRALQGFVRPGGQLLLFRRTTDAGFTLPPSLELAGNYPLVEALQSQLMVLSKLG